MQSADELRNRIFQQASEDSEFRKQLLEEPKVAIESLLGIAVPDRFQVNVVEDSPKLVTLVLPPLLELDESALEAAVGGSDIDTGDWLDDIWS